MALEVEVVQTTLMEGLVDTQEVVEEDKVVQVLLLVVVLELMAL